MTEHNKQEPAHLHDHRSAIVLRSILVGAASILPVPGVTEALTGSLRRGLMQHVAGLRKVDMEEDALDALLADSPKAKRLTLFSALGGIASMLGPRQALRRLFIGLQVLRGVEEGAKAFQLATLLDHYCAVHHVGPGISVDRARKLRGIIDAASAGTQRELAGETLTLLASQGMQIATAVPAWVWAHIRRTGEAPALPELPSLMQTTHELLAHLSVRGYLGRLTDTFDRKWSGGTVITVN